MKGRISLLLGLALTINGVEPVLRVAVFHPFVADLVKQAGGERLEVLEFLPHGAAAQHFEPSSVDLVKLKGCQVIFASGLGMEASLVNLRDSEGLNVIEVGATVEGRRSLEQECMHGACSECENEPHGVDPHWWHSSENVRRAVRFIAEELGAVDPGGREIYLANAEAAGRRIHDVAVEMRRDLEVVPREARILMTSSAAFGYFCEEYSFSFVPVCGFCGGDEVWAEVIATIQGKGVRALFPGDDSNADVIRRIAQETGVILGRHLCVDGVGGDFRTVESMTRYNVAAIVDALGVKTIL